ncbi:MAG: PD40 domain-containing protein [Acidimicrobiia bacterium]|nr:PD40 domain-containing protein [Acidimicrobiia bacterium]
MRLLGIMLLVLLAACAGASDEPAGESPVVILADDGNILVYDPADGESRALTDDAGPDRIYSQPTWSPDGSQVAFVASAALPEPGVQASAPAVRVGLEAQAVTGAIHITDADGTDTVVVPTPFVAFYLYWSPDGATLAFLGNDIAAGRQGLAMIDVAAGTARRVDNGQPYYFAWSPESDRLLVHARNEALYYLDPDGSQTSIDQEPGVFSAPHWQGSTQLYPTRGDDGQTLGVYEEDGTLRRPSVTPELGVAFGLSPAEDRLAYLQLSVDASPFRLGTLVVDEAGETMEIASGVAAFFWSPSGERLLYLTPAGADADLPLQWNLWDGATTTSFEQHLPTLTFVQQYLPFFGQYANSLTFFSPDETRFTFSGTIPERGEGIWVQPIDGAPAELIAPGRFSTWAP